jgi:hypothetical protein
MCLRMARRSPSPIRTGVSDGKLTEMVSGDLKAGDEVITSSKQAAK